MTYNLLISGTLWHKKDVELFQKRLTSKHQVLKQVCRLLMCIVASLQKRGLLPTARDFLKVKPEVAPKIDLRQQTYDLLPLVREPSSEEKASLEKRGLVFLPVQAKSYAQVITEDPDYFWPNELQIANRRVGLRDFTPSVMEVALNPTQLALPDSFGKSRPVQLMMIEQYSQEEIEREFPDAKAIMLHVTAYAQIDRAYKQRTGEILFRIYFARGLDNVSEVNATYAGRIDPDGQFDVGGWYAGDGRGFVGAVPAVVFIRNML